MGDGTLGRALRGGGLGLLCALAVGAAPAHAQTPVATTTTPSAEGPATPIAPADPDATPPAAPSTPATGPDVPEGPSTQTERLYPGPTAKEAWVARVVAPTFAKARPWGANRQAVEPRATWGGGVNQLLVLDTVEVVRDPRRPGDERVWVRVALPRRPNGSSGWIPADYLEISRTRYRVHVSTTHRLVQVFRDGRQVRRFRAVVGAPSTPTPHGLFAVNEEIRQPDPKAFLGPWALHLTAFSNVLDNYGGGPGRVAIHGRSGASLLDPLGTARSHGCVRVANVDVAWLATHLEPGVPVRIEAGLIRPGAPV